MQCDMCGKQGQLYDVLMDGVSLSVCEKCSRFGKVMKKVEAEISRKKIMKKTFATIEIPEEIEKIVDNYAKLIRNARDKLGLTQKELSQKMAEKESIISKVESGAMTPNVSLAKKFERALNLKLVYVEEVKEIKLDKPIDGRGLTIGDLLKK